MRLTSTRPADGTNVLKAKEFIDQKIRESQVLLKSRKALMSPDDYKKHRDVLQGQKDLYECLLGFKW